MIEKYFGGDVPELDVQKIRFNDSGERIKEKLNLPLAIDIIHGIGEHSDFNFSAALAGIWEVVNMANKYVEETKPWNLSKEGKTEALKAFIRLLVEVIRNVSETISPFMPRTAQSIKEQIGNEKINKGQPLFPRIEEK